MKINELQSRYKTEDDPDVRERLLMMIWLKKGKTTYEVADLLNCPQSKIAYWKSKFDRVGLDGLRTKPKSGKPSALSNDQVKFIKNKLESQQYWQTIWVCEMIFKETGQKYTKRHITRLLHTWGFSKIIPRKEHRLADKVAQENFSKKREIYWAKSKMAGQ